MKYAKCAIKVDPNQFSDPLAPMVAAADVDPLECCASCDALTAADAVWLPAVTV
jgi:hypothetical protein